MRGLTAGVALALVFSATPAVADTLPYLSAPTGHRPVGATSLYPKDTSRVDPWVPSVPYRELMVSVFYPVASANGPKAQYVTPAESAAMLKGSGIQAPPDASLRTDWERDWAQMTEWKRWVEVAGTVHPSFTDVGLFADQYGVNIGATTTAERTQAITRAYVNAFFDQHLRGKPSSLLDAPSARYPEIAFCK
ncbi:hypothetical protein JOF56_007105 [Kibdelosporangium banguiense]|uniref:Uncharacterized protein n=1 Tax=Kibdelosporangium banguiense TaxID=1365924 RepID=A0ABS4TRZ4_9PSEU|nr:hypothetical protein [Kibdelosporangium banguiense]MBP2326720.1 hypothetical protein [Kibdelosporangium banguiense]